MKTAGNTIIYLSLLAVLAGCTEKPSQEEPAGDFISFYGRSVYLSSGTKGIVQDENMTLPIVVTDDSESSPAFTEEEVGYSYGSIWTSDKQWESGKHYTLYAYIISQDSEDSGTSAGKIEVLGDLANTNRSSGTHFKVEQPESYSPDEESYADFLLSYPVQADGTDKPLVSLDFERTMACVELYMTRTTNPSVTVNNVTFSNVTRSATYYIRLHGDGDFRGMKNVWQVTEADSPVSYSYSGPDGNGISLNEKTDDKDRFDDSYRIMRFLVPYQSLTDGHTLTVDYTASEGSGTASQASKAVFNLSGYDPEEWVYGHRIRYYVSIDTGARLEGAVDQWRDVDYIEGTFLPD